MLIEMLKERGIALTFTMLEVGALPVGAQEPIHQIPELFPGSRVVSFEVDEALCHSLNANAPLGVEYHAVALGRAEEERTFFETVHPMCGSLYEPDERYADVFQNLDVMRLKAKSSIKTLTLDRFRESQSIPPIDFIKMDVQGAELEIFQGGADSMASVLCVVCEVGFVPLYKDQPLFGDVDRFLRSRGMMLHKFLGLAGRALKPIVLNNDTNFPVQHLWSDAVYARDLLNPMAMTEKQLLKLAVFMEMYQSVDVTRYLLSHFDARTGSRLTSEFETRLMQGNG